MGVSNAGKWGDSQKKEFFINNSIKSLIPFKEEYQGLFKLHTALGWRVPVWKKIGLSPKEGIFFEVEYFSMRILLRMRILFRFKTQLKGGCLEAFNKEKKVRQQKEKVL